MANFTPQEIEEMLREFFDTVGKRQYIGARYVPIFGRKDESSIEWDNTKPYEPLTIVLYLGNSYTSRQYVPIGADILDTDFWANTGNYNAQVEQYRSDVRRLSNEWTVYRESLELWKDETENALLNRITVDYNTVADMCADIKLAVGMVCHTKGFRNIGDGGSGYYIIAETATPNNMDIFSTVNGFAMLCVQYPLNVLTLGADPTGNIDSSPMINRAIAIITPTISAGTLIPNNDALTGASIYIPHGKYLISNPINVWVDRTITSTSTSNFTGITIYGDSENSTYLYSDGNTSTCFEIGGYCSVKNIRIGNFVNGITLGASDSGAPYCALENIIINDCQYGIYYYDGYLTQISHVHVIRATQWAFYFVGFFTSITMLDCYANGCGNGYNLSANGRLVYSSLINCACDGADISYRINGGSSLTLIGCGCEHTNSTELYVLGTNLEVITLLNINNFTSYDLEENAYQIRVASPNASINVDGYNIWHRHSDKPFLSAGTSTNVYHLKANNISPKPAALVDVVSDVVYGNDYQFQFTNDGTYKTICGLDNLKGKHDYVDGIIIARVTTNAPIDSNTTYLYKINVNSGGARVFSNTENPAGWSDTNIPTLPHVIFSVDSYRNLQVMHTDTTSTTAFRVQLSSDYISFGNIHAS